MAEYASAPPTPTPRRASIRSNSEAAAAAPVNAAAAAAAPVIPVAVAAAEPEVRPGKFRRLSRSLGRLILGILGILKYMLWIWKMPFKAESKVNN